MYYREVTWWVALITMVIAMNVILGICAYLILIERKIAAYAQDRLGPNRVGPWGLLQPIADGVKFLLKEDIIPEHVDRVFYLLAPAVAVSTSLFAMVVVPFGPTSAAPERPWPETVSEARAEDQADHLPPPGGGEPFTEKLARYNDTYQFAIAPHVNVGFLLLFAVGSLAVYGIILAGWSSNSKYSFLGALRSSAQIISYEIPMGLSILGVVLLAGSLNLERIVDQQAQGVWNIAYQPLAFVLFLTAIFAECNRLPFDLPEAEQELVGGYHTEYSSMKFALFFLGEYAHMIVTSYLLAAFFLGGWHLPGVGALPRPWLMVIGTIILFLKMFAVILFSMFIRWTIPRFRFDQLMGLTWKVFIPLALLNVLAVMVVQQYLPEPRGVIGWVVLFVWSLLLMALAGALGLRRPREPRQHLVVYRGHERIEIAR
jgi:NADH-quinone oxidoreductase subunit H